MDVLFSLQARNAELFLPGMMKILQVGSDDAKVKILLALRNVLRQLKKTKASFIAVQLVGRLLPLFDSVRLMCSLSPSDGHWAMRAALQPSPASSTWRQLHSPGLSWGGLRAVQPSAAASGMGRSEERRVGEECMV